MNVSHGLDAGRSVLFDGRTERVIDSATRGRTTDAGLDASEVIERLEEAGATLLALPSSGYSTRLRVSQLEFIREAREVYGSDLQRLRPATPTAERITRMDEALGRLQRIPQSRYVLRRIVGARSLVNPVTARHLFSWRKLGTVMGADHKAVQRWHAEGIATIVTALAQMDVRTA